MASRYGRELALGSGLRRPWISPPAWMSHGGPHGPAPDRGRPDMKVRFCGEFGHAALTKANFLPGVLASTYCLGFLLLSVTWRRGQSNAMKCTVANDERT